MRIATWNVERLKHYRHVNSMLQQIESAKADILVLTETDTRLSPDFAYQYRTPMLHEIRPDYYGQSENRIAVLTKYRLVKRHETYDPYTAICVELETESGNLLVYGTIMGILGNREASFKTDLRKQMEDLLRLSADGNRVCVIGDYNLSFHDNYYFTCEGRDLVLQTFQKCGIELLTKSIPECIDHIAVSQGFAGPVTAVSEWNLNKTLSDHKGIVVELGPVHELQPHL